MELIARGDAMAYLERCRAENARILGIEAFRRIDDHLVPIMDAILDLGSLDDPTASIEEARRFIADLDDPGLLLEFVLA
jgi:hypothetical protein